MHATQRRFLPGKKGMSVCSPHLLLPTIDFFYLRYVNRLLGLCNNFAYVIMLSAAHDILREENGEKNKTEPVS